MSLQSLKFDVKNYSREPRRTCNLQVVRMHRLNMRSVTTCETAPSMPQESRVLLLVSD